MKGSPAPNFLVPKIAAIPPVRRQLTRASLEKQSLFLSDSARAMQLIVPASRGAGKSRFFGRVLAPQDILRGIPTIIFDSVGGTVDELFAKLDTLPDEDKRSVAARILYINTSSDRIVPSPIYSQLGNESLYAVVSRFAHVIEQASPELRSASVQGLKALREVALNVGSILFPLGYGITTAPDLLFNTEAWLERIDQAVQINPEAADAQDWFRFKYVPLLHRDKETLTMSFLRELEIFRDPIMKATFGAPYRGINWPEFEDYARVIIIDTRDETDPQIRSFKNLWYFRETAEYVQHRGKGKEKPVSIIIDELSSYIGRNTSSPAIAKSFDDLVNIYARNHNVWLSCGFQELHQFDPEVQETLMTFGNKLIGSTTNQRTAELYAMMFAPFKPYWVKDHTPVWGSFTVPRGGNYHEIIDQTPTYFSVNEQLALNAQAFLNLPTFHFLAAFSPREGTIGRQLLPVSIAEFDAGEFPVRRRVEEIRAQLRESCGRTKDEILAEMESRQKRLRHLSAQPAPSHPEAEGREILAESAQGSLRPAAPLSIQRPRKPRRFVDA